uniref:Uncharacterized protein n=1 Tax=Ditylenchus dipsaci TaxID=166011 RepID=A0A915DVS4_9BILA
MSRYPALCRSSRGNQIHQLVIANDQHSLGPANSLPYRSRWSSWSSFVDDCANNQVKEVILVVLVQSRCSHPAIGKRAEPSSIHLFSAVPGALMARVLSPAAFRAEILSPRALTAFVLTPEALIAEVLSPKVLDTRILSPESLIVKVLSPSLLAPKVLSPETIGITVLSPSILSPHILSGEKLMLEVSVFGIDFVLEPRLAGCALKAQCGFL